MQEKIIVEESARDRWKITYVTSVCATTLSPIYPDREAAVAIALSRYPGVAIEIFPSASRTVGP